MAGKDRRTLRSPYEGARVEELQEPLLPRWFAILAVLTVPVAIGVGLWAVLAFGGGDLPVEARRPAPTADSPLTTPVGEYVVGDLDPVTLAPECAALRGIRAGGTAVDTARIATAIDALCDITLPEAIGRRLQAFARAGGVVRFAQFEATGIDSALDPSGDVPVVLINARFARESTDPVWIAPLVVHDTTFLELNPADATAALEARQGEAEICARLFVDADPSRACADADALLALPSPIDALQSQGFN